MPETSSSTKGYTDAKKKLKSMYEGAKNVVYNNPLAVAARGNKRVNVSGPKKRTAAGTSYMEKQVASQVKSDKRKAAAKKSSPKK